MRLNILLFCVLVISKCMVVIVSGSKFPDEANNAPTAFVILVHFAIMAGVILFDMITNPQHAPRDKGDIDYRDWCIEHGRRPDGTKIGSEALRPARPPRNSVCGDEVREWTNDRHQPSH